MKVAPLVGAWIEICMVKEMAEKYRSLLSWERGLKFVISGLSDHSSLVAPLVGAWIEIPFFIIL